MATCARGEAATHLVLEDLAMRDRNAPRVTTRGASSYMKLRKTTTKQDLKVPKVSEWDFISFKRPAYFEDKKTTFPGYYGKLYYRGEKGNEDSMVRYYVGKKLAYCAWGKLHEQHCGAHVVRTKDGKWHTPVLGCPQIIPISKRGKVVGLKISTPKGFETFI